MNKEQIEQLLRPESFAHPVTEISIIETHISWVLLTGDYVYKIKKPVDFGFLDFSTLEKRHFYCQEELRLNTRQSGDLYIGLAAVIRRGGALFVVPAQEWLNGPSFQDDASAELVDYAVQLVQFKPGSVLGECEDQYRNNKSFWQDLASCIAGFHLSLPPILAEDGSSAVLMRETIEAAAKQNFTQIRPYLSASQDQHLLDFLESWTLEAIEVLASCFDARIKKGATRECHGDLHLGNIVVLDGVATPFDCIEFSAEFRCIDVASEMAFLLMDMERGGLGRQANWVLNRYLEVSGDYEMVTLLQFYKVYRALVRAKVCLLNVPLNERDQLSVTEFYDESLGYMEYAKRLVSHSHCFLGLMHGLSGSGKSYAASELASFTDCIVVRSDIERKRIFNVPLDARPCSGSIAIYTPQATKQTFDRLAEIVGILLDAGVGCIVDATFLSYGHRQAFLNIARERSIPYFLFSCDAPEDLLVDRLQRRQLENQDASDADVSVMQAQKASAEPLRPSELGYVLVLTQPLRNFASVAQDIKART
jgi:hypothetical protein